jgi:hypothetical protein
MPNFTIRASPRCSKVHRLSSITNVMHKDIVCNVATTKLWIGCKHGKLLRDFLVAATVSRMHVKAQGVV